MDHEKNIYRIDVSEYYFRMTTECIRLHSNLRHRYAALNDVVDDRVKFAEGACRNHPPSTLKEHLKLIPAKGNIPLEIEILETNAGKINDVALDLSSIIGTSVGFSEALSVIMFDFMVEANRTEVLTKIGFTSQEAARYRQLLKPNAPGVKSIN